MNRRLFLQTTLAAAVALAIPGGPGRSRAPLEILELEKAQRGDLLLLFATVDDSCSASYRIHGTPDGWTELYRQPMDCGGQDHTITYALRSEGGWDCPPVSVEDTAAKWAGEWGAEDYQLPIRIEA